MLFSTCQIKGILTVFCPKFGLKFYKKVKNIFKNLSDEEKYEKSEIISKFIFLKNKFSGGRGWHCGPVEQVRPASSRHRKPRPRPSPPPPSPGRRAIATPAGKQLQWGQPGWKCCGCCRAAGQWHCRESECGLHLPGGFLFLIFFIKFKKYF